MALDDVIGRMRGRVLGICGAVLAAGCASDPADAGGSGGGSGGGGGGGGSGGNGGLFLDPATLPAMPHIRDPSDPSCQWTPVSPEEFSGPCCDEVGCVTPDAGLGCPDPTSPDFSFGRATGVDAPGSGVCQCGDVTGPFARASVSTTVAQEGACCYVVPTQGCQGRPLRIGDELRLAPVVYGRIWA